MDDKMQRLARSDLLMLWNVPIEVQAPMQGISDVIVAMQAAQELAPTPAPAPLTTQPSLPRSRPPARSALRCQCAGHGTLLERLDRARTDQLVILDTFGADDAARALVPCCCAAGQERAKRWRGLPDEAQGVYLDNGRIRHVKAQETAIAQITAFMQTPRGWLTLAGGYGVGKTVLIYAALNHLADRGLYGRYVMMPELLNELRDAIGTDHYGERLRRLIEAPILAIDELDKLRDTPFVDDVLYAIFLARYRDRARQGTIIGYNLDGESRIPPFLASRIRDGRFHLEEMGTADLRPIANKLDPWRRGEGEDI